MEKRMIAEKNLTVDNAASIASEYLKTIPTYPEGQFEGRGIVICAGGVRYLTCAWVLINMLRKHGCTLPIELWYLGEDEGDPQWIDLVKPLGVECIDAHKVRDRHPHPRLGGWESKAYAILHSRFKEVLLLDADNVPVKDPAFLFDTPEYKQTGAVFWPDCGCTSSDCSAWDVFGVDKAMYLDEREQESGQILINKESGWEALHLCNWFNMNSDFFYQHVYGDKDTFLFAWRRLAMPYTMVEKPASVIPYSLLQYDLSGNPIFQHRIHDKWSLSGNHQTKSFQHERECSQFVDQLNRTWRPVEHLTRNLLPVDHDAMQALVGTRFEYQKTGRNRWPMELGSAGSISCGRSSEALFWWSDSGDLVLAGQNGRPSVRLRLGDNRVWKGTSLKQRGKSVRLLPQPIATVPA